MADTSICTDLGLKARLYASAGVREYWVVDLGRRRIVTHAQPEDGRYAAVQTLAGRETVATSALPDASWTVDEILGPPAAS